MEDAISAPEESSRPDRSVDTVPVVSAGDASAGSKTHSSSPATATKRQTPTLTTLPVAALTTPKVAATQVVTEGVQTARRVASSVKELSGLVSEVVDTILSPLSTTTTPPLPAPLPALSTLLAFAGRELGHTLPTPQLASVPAAAPPFTATPIFDNMVSALSSDVQHTIASVTTAAVDATRAATFTGEPSLVSQLFVAALRVVNPILKAVGINLIGTSLTVPFITDGIPPFFLTFGLKVGSSEYNGWKVWTIAPANPSGKVVVAIHGGGFISQASIFHWITYTSLVRDTGATVIVPLYPLANAAGTGGTAATVIPQMADFIAEQVDTYGVDNVSVLGDSAGGTIALAAAQELVRRCKADPTCINPQTPGHMVLFSPPLDLSLTNPNIALVDDPLLDTKSGLKIGGYWADGLSLTDPLVSPIYGSLEGLPPITVYDGSLDLLSADVIRLQQEVVEHNAEDPSDPYEFTFELRHGEIHDWLIFAFLPDAVAIRPDVYRDLGLTANTAV
jgi:acetyl esterase/lipase